jgi:hypothetical protein
MITFYPNAHYWDVYTSEFENFEFGKSIIRVSDRFISWHSPPNRMYIIEYKKESPTFYICIDRFSIDKIYDISEDEILVYLTFQ